MCSHACTGMMEKSRKPLRWIGSTLDDLRAFPDQVRWVMGHALDIAQRGGKHPDAKPLRGFGGAGVLEIIDEDGDTYRAVYTVRFAGVVYGSTPSRRSQRLAFQRRSGRWTSSDDD